jgi:hypothetical protein
MLSATPQKITFGEMRESGIRYVIIYCRDHRCSHHVETNADVWVMTSSCRTSRTDSPARPAVVVARRYGRRSARPGWVQVKVPWSLRLWMI